MSSKSKNTHIQKKPHCKFASKEKKNVVLCTHQELTKEEKHFVNGQRGKTYITTLHECKTCLYRS